MDFLHLISTGYSWTKLLVAFRMPRLLGSVLKGKALENSLLNIRRTLSRDWLIDRQLGSNTN